MNTPKQIFKSFIQKFKKLLLIGSAALLLLLGSFQVISGDLVRRGPEAASAQEYIDEPPAWDGGVYSQGGQSGYEEIASGDVYGGGQIDPSTSNIDFSDNSGYSGGQIGYEPIYPDGYGGGQTGYEPIYSDGYGGGQIGYEPIPGAPGPVYTDDRRPSQAAPSRPVYTDSRPVYTDSRPSTGGTPSGPVYSAPANTYNTNRNYSNSDSNSNSSSRSNASSSSDSNANARVDIDLDNRINIDNTNTQNQSQSMTVNLPPATVIKQTKLNPVVQTRTREVVREVPTTVVRDVDRPIYYAVASPQPVQTQPVQYVSPQVVTVSGDNQKVQELPKTGLPLASLALGALIPAGLRLRKFGAKKQEASANYLWEERQLGR